MDEIRLKIRKIRTLNAKNDRSGKMYKPVVLESDHLQQPHWHNAYLAEDPALYWKEGDLVVVKVKTSRGQDGRTFYNFDPVTPRVTGFVQNLEPNNFEPKVQLDSVQGRTLSEQEVNELIDSKPLTAQDLQVVPGRTLAEAWEEIDKLKQEIYDMKMEDLRNIPL